MAGVPEGHPDVNVALHRGKWPFIRGGRYRNDCDLHCTAVALTRDVQAGEELVYSYGEASTTGFALKFGAVATPLEWCNPNDEAEVVLPEEMLEPPVAVVGEDADQDEERLRSLRSRALSIFGLVAGTSLMLEEAEMEQVGAREAELTEEGGLAAATLLALLLSGSHDFVTACCACAQRGALLGCGLMAELDALEALKPPRAKVGAGLVELIEHNLRRLPTLSTTADLERCAEPSTSYPEIVALRARIKQRELLGRWRERVCREYGLPVAVTDEDVLVS